MITLMNGIEDLSTVLTIVICRASMHQNCDNR